ncbi:MAG: hypothetical protein ACJ71Z_08615 [Aeromicrobium sp.]
MKDPLPEQDSMPAETVGVVVIGTGPIGKEALRGVINHPGLELRGVGVFSAEKDGVDAGTLCGLPTVGIPATRDWDSLTSSKPDCIAYFADGAMRTADAVNDISEALRSGVNVVTTSLLGAIYPASMTPELKEPLHDAAIAGGSTLWATGIDPGFATTQLPLALLAVADTVHAVRLYELGDISTYPVEWIMHDVYGYGQPLDFESPLMSAGILKEWWRGTVEEIAHVLGAEVDDLTFTHEVAPTVEGAETAWGSVAPGTIGAIRFVVTASVNGRPFVTLEHVDRVDPLAGPQWRSPIEAKSISYRVEVEGRPAFRAEMSFDRETDYEPGAGATAMHAVNAIPAVVAAQSGVLGFRDLPAFYGRRTVGA